MEFSGLNNLNLWLCNGLIMALLLASKSNILHLHFCILLRGRTIILKKLFYTLMKIKTLVILMLFFLVKTNAFSQMYAGAGYAGGQLSVSGLDDAQGVSFYLIKEINMGESRFRIDPALNIALLFSEINKDPVLAFYATMTSLTPMVAYEVIQSKRVTIAPFVGPYANWVVGFKGESILFESDYRNEVRFGLEFGLAANILIKDNFSIKIIPFNLQLTRFKGDAYSPDGFNYVLKFTSSILVTL